MALDLPDHMLWKEKSIWMLRLPLEECQPTFVAEHLAAWKLTPWHGDFYGRNLKRWKPRRTYFEFFRRITAADLPNTPSAWEAWFKAHPNLVWDEKLKRLVEGKAEVKP
jgi:hypothetical protein